VSLLSKGNATVTIQPPVYVADEDGNLMPTYNPADEFTAWVRLQPSAQSGTSARRAEQDNEGFESEELYSLRFVRGQEDTLDPMTKVIWDGKTWHIFGYPKRYNGSLRTKRLEYLIRRT
jgi:hypothetical protein